MKLLFCCIILFLSGYKSGAQTVDKWVHAGLSMASYKGDLSTFDQYSATFQAGIQLNRKENFNGAFNISIGSVSGENKDFRSSEGTPNRFFKSTIFMLNYDLHYNIIKKQNLIFYISQGIGLIRFKPKDEFDEDLQDKAETRAENEIYRNIALMLPTQIGVIYLLPNNFGFGGQFGLQNPLTDYIDNISELGKSGNDNILSIRLSLYIPLINGD